jgi:hypothetical protein
MNMKTEKAPYLVGSLFLEPSDTKSIFFILLKKIQLY